VENLQPGNFQEGSSQTSSRKKELNSVRLRDRDPWVLWIDGRYPDQGSFMAFP
jgi:hypothetical protein